MFSESCNDRNRRIGDRVAMRCRNHSAEIGNNFAEICDDAAGIVDIAAIVIPC